MSGARRIPFLFALLLLAVAPVAAHAQTGTIAGTVVEDGTLTPLGSTDSQPLIIHAFTPDGAYAGGGAPDAAGHYQIVNLTPGSYFVRASAPPGHVAELHNNIACIAVDCPPTAGTPVVVAASGTTTVDFSLAKEGLITGTVRRAANGTGIGTIQVAIYNANTSLVTTVATASDGTYVVKGLATGTYLARTYHLFGDTSTVDYVTELYGGVSCPTRLPERDCRILASAPIAVTAGASTSGVDFLLDKGASITGKVTTAESAGTAINNATVLAYLGEIEMARGTADATGTYTIKGLPAGRYRVRTAGAIGLNLQPVNVVDEWQNGVCVGCSGPQATVAAGADEAVTGVDFSLAVGGTISGSAVCNIPNGFERGPTIAVYSSTGQFVKSVGASGVCGASTPSTYTVTGLTAGTYFLWARDVPLIPFGTNFQGGKFIDQLYGGAPCNTADCDVRKGTPVSVVAGTTTAGIDFSLQLGYGASVQGNELVKVYDARGVEMINAVGVAIVGPFRQLIHGLPAGAYYVTFDGSAFGSVNCLDCPATGGLPIVLGPNESSRVLFANPGAGRVSGTITNASGGAPLSTITVELVSRSGRVVKSASSDLFGRYTVTGLGAGTYFARTVNDRGFVDEIYQDAGCGACDPRLGAPIVVSVAPEVTGIDFVLAQGGTLTGLVSDTAGVVLGDVPVSLFAGATTPAGVVRSSASGRFRASAPAGTYRAIAEATTNKGSEVYSEMPCTSAGCDPAIGTAIAVTTGAITSSIDFTLTSCSAMTVSPPMLATAVSGATYRQVLTATGGTGPYVFDVTDGHLPLGLALNPSTGVLSGSPTAPGRSTFRVSALDASGCATDRSYAIDVQQCAFRLSPSSATVPAAGGTVTVTIANGCGGQEVTQARDWYSVQSLTPTEITLAVQPNVQSQPRAVSIGIGRRVFELRQAGVGSASPFGSLDLPADGAQVSGAVALGGWALDDLEVTNVRIFRDHVAGEPAGIVFLGNAVFIPGARPDVQQGFAGFPRSDRAGFGYMILTNTLPNQGNGNFRIHAVAEDAEGHQTLLGSRTIVGNNTTATVPFGTIDTPLQGDTISGANYINFGWALTPQPAMIPTDGSTMQVIIDGVPIGTVDYNHFRPDVSNTFPGLANSGGPVGFRAFDTTALAEGLHTISWMVTDSRPATAGLGSRYFTVVNSADGPAGGGSSVTATETTEPVADVAKPLGAAPAPDLGRRAESVAVDANDQRVRGHRLTLAAMERAEIALDQLVDASPDSNNAACPATWAGYLSKDNVLSDLPVGASLDPAGTFYWQTGPGFAGRFALVFVRTNCRGEKQQVPVTVTIPIR
jgi:hypothetical protein